MTLDNLLTTETVIRVSYDLVLSVRNHCRVPDSGYNSDKVKQNIMN